jgi:multicomponent Na+:H+ antiporter subunit D
MYADALILPLLVPLLTAVLCLLAYRSRLAQRVISLSGSLALAGIALWLLLVVSRQGIQASYIGNWPAPFGITLVADILSAFLVLLAGTIGLAVNIYALASIDAEREHFGFHALYHFLLMGVCGAFLTGDLFNLYVWFEVMLMASFVLLALGGERGQMEGGIKYVTLNLVSSALFLATVGITYGLAGTLNLADLSQRLAVLGPETHGLQSTLATLFMVAFGIKAALFPLFFWLPASYHTPPVAVSGIFAGLLTKVGVYSLIRVFTLIFVHQVWYTHSLLLIVAGITMVVGVLGAVAQNEFRRLLAFHSVSQVGYMVMGLGLFSPLGLAASLLFMGHHSLVKTNLFLISGVVAGLQQSFLLKKLGGLYRLRPGLALLFLFPALSLAGLPPLSGFVVKLGLVQAGLLQGQYAIVLVSLGVSVLTLYSMMKIWNEAFWKPVPQGQAEAGRPVIHLGWRLMPVAALAVLTIAAGLSAGPLAVLALAAGEQLMNPAEYITAVLGTLP